jgi:predicted dienelactone hydrolase
MKPKIHWPATFSLLLIAALLVACSGQTATPAPPAATPVPPTPAPAAATPVPPTAAAAQPTPVPPTPAPAAAPQAVPHQPRPDAPTYAKRGPYGVGVRDFVIDTPERKVPVTVWYPAQNPDGKEEAVTYAMDFLADPAAGFPTAGRARRDATPDLSGGPYPLVIYSHGAWCFPAIASFYTEHLASHGFVVMAPTHEDNWGTLFQSYYKSQISRPREVVQVLNFAEKLTAPDGKLTNLIDLQKVAVSGQSFGGQIALEMGGARLNLADWAKNYCPQYPKDTDCAGYPAHFEEMASLAGLKAVPEGLWPDWSDPRIDVVVATAPDASKLGGNALAGLRRPILLLHGTSDVWVGSGLAYAKPFDNVASPQKTRVLFENADHMIFSNACPAYPGMVDAGMYVVCSDSVWDMDRVHDLTNHFVTAFLLAELKGDAEAAKALAPENVSFTGVKYETTAYGK